MPSCCSDEIPTLTSALTAERSSLDIVLVGLPVLRRFPSTAAPVRNDHECPTQSCRHRFRSRTSGSLLQVGDGLQSPYASIGKSRTWRQYERPFQSCTLHLILLSQAFLAQSHHPPSRLRQFFQMAGDASSAT